MGSASYPEVRSDFHHTNFFPDCTIAMFSRENTSAIEERMDAAGEVEVLPDDDLLLPLPHEIQQQLKDVDEIEIERQRTPDR